jgi:Uma2 family endonuclease
MSVVEKVRSVSPDEYIEGEQNSDVRHEYVAGQLYVMVGASRAHNRISLNLAAALRTRLRGSPCEAFIADVKVRVENAFFYPDVVVACDPTDAHDFYVESPTLVAEVLSPFTEARDTLEKRIAYQSLSSLKEYLLIAQDKIQVRIYRRLQDGWELETCTPGDALRLSSLQLEIDIGEIYEGVLTA